MLWLWFWGLKGQSLKCCLIYCSRLKLLHLEKQVGSYASFLMAAFEIGKIMYYTCMCMYVIGVEKSKSNAGKTLVLDYRNKNVKGGEKWMGNQEEIWI